MTLPNVASVTLVADPLRRERLEPWLHVVGEPVGYHLGWVEPSQLIGDEADTAAVSVPDVLVLDGPSVLTTADRVALLRAAQSPHFRFATLLYVEAVSGEVEGVEVLSADEVVPSGPRQEARMARLVQAVAMAPWKRAERLKARARRLQDGSLRELPGGRRPASLVSNELFDGALEMGPHLAKLMMESVRAGRAAGAEAAFTEMAALCAEYAVEIETVRASLCAAADGGWGLPLEQDQATLSRLAGAADAVVTLRQTLRSTATAMSEALEAEPAPILAASADGTTSSSDPSEDPTP